MSDFLPSEEEQHVAPLEPHPLPKSAWQRWRDWSGSNFIISILVHVVIILVATLLVVQVMQPREKPKFKAGPPSPNPPSEHSVKAAKKSASMSVPTISKRITTTAANASVALPAMEMNSSMPDMMSTALNNLGEGSMGGGASAGGVGALPPGGLTSFGFKNGGVGIKGHFYDLKQFPDRKVTEVNGATDKEITSHVKILSDFFQGGWDEKVLQKYYQAKDVMVAPQIFMPIMNSDEATKAFGVDRETKGLHWVVLYKGTVVAPSSGRFRFLGYGDDMIAVRFDNQDVFASAFPQPQIPEMLKKALSSLYSSLGKENLGKDIQQGKWISVERGKSYPIQVLISEAYGGKSAYMLMMEEEHPEKPYPHRKDDPDHLAYPVFQMKKGIPIPTGGFEVAPDPIIFLAK